MKIRLRVPYVFHMAGEIVDLPPGIAKVMVDVGSAELAPQECGSLNIETAELALPAETTEAPKAKRAKRLKRRGSKR